MPVVVLGEDANGVKTAEVVGPVRDTGRDKVGYTHE